MDLTITTLAERPQLESTLWEMRTLWPEFMTMDPIANLYYDRAGELFPHLALVATTAEHPDIVAGRGFTIPFSLRGNELPDTGWDAVIRWGIEDHIDGRAPTHLSALEISLDPSIRGQGVAAEMIEAMRSLARGLGLDTLVAPVRPTAKHVEPGLPMADYLTATRPDGLPTDPWLRTHVRAGGEIVRIAERSMVITGSLEQWRKWTGEPFDEAGQVIVDGGLVPVICDPDRNLAIYIEPNVWVRHRVV